MDSTEQGLRGWERSLDDQRDGREKGRRFAIPKAGPKAALRKTCPPHTPAITASVPGGGYETKCLVCKARGPKGATTVEAKLAFDAALGL
jgi:hypothetical protein